jgi:hypothetical protein
MSDDDLVAVPSNYSHPHISTPPQRADTGAEESGERIDGNDQGDAVCLVQLSIPATGSDGMPVLFSNDMILSKAVRGEIAIYNPVY